VTIVALTTPVVDLRPDEQQLLLDLVQVWHQKRRRNVLRTVYYEGKNALEDFGIAVPPKMSQIDVTLGWISKGVHALSDRSVFEGFVSAGDEEGLYGIDEIAATNDFVNEFPMATVESAKLACSFITVTRGAVAEGEPEILFAVRSADSSAAIWDRRRRRLVGYLSVVDFDMATRLPTQMVLYTPQRYITLTRNTNGRWSTYAVTHGLGEVPVARVPYKPAISRPFGHSRITRAGMYHTDAALRVLLRAEVSGEFYSAIEYWLFGANVENFVGGDKWSAVMGRIKALDTEEGEAVPTLHRFQGASPEPHIAQLRMHATLFAGDQGLSLSQLGIVQDNPASADAMYAAKEDLITDTRTANRTWGAGAVKAMQLAVRLRDGLDDVPKELRTLGVQFTDPAIVSPGAAADAFSKRAAAIPGFATSEVGLESAGLTREQIRRFQAEQRRQGVGSVLESIRTQVPPAAVADPAAPTPVPADSA
jgi:hypothetical protein